MELNELLEQLRDGKIEVEEALNIIESYSYVDMRVALVDNGRLTRCGFPETVLGQYKTPGQLLQIIEGYIKHSLPILVTRLTDEQMAALRRERPEIRLNELARTGTWKKGKENPDSKPGELVICCAGTSDLRVAEEARETALFLGRDPVLIKDVGIAGVHRLLAHRDILQRARALIVVAGMEGALPGVVAGLVSVPVIAVPTSVGYGVSQGGIAALLSMLSSCSSGITVVNIDNGFGAACASERILSVVLSLASKPAVHSTL